MNLRASFRRLKGILHPRSPAPTILMYHRVASVVRDPWDLAVTPDCFEAQMAYLRRKHIPLPLDSFVDNLVAGTLPARAVAVTFDDGYRDNLVHAKPILVKHGVPATLFLTTGWVGSPSPFWWDELADMILGSRTSVEVSLFCGAEKVDLRWGEPTSVDLENRWRASAQPQTERQTTYLRVWRTLQRTSVVDRHLTMGALRQLLAPLDADSLSLPMSTAEVQEFANGAGLSLGAHTISHPALTWLPEDECKAEILQSQLDCRKYTEDTVRSFAYPYGDMSSRERNAVETADFHCACSTRASHVDRDCHDRFALPRIAARQEPLESFAQKMRV